jgi:hypothetical protein
LFPITVTMNGYKYPLNSFVKLSGGTIHRYIGNKENEYSSAIGLSEVLSHFPGAEKRDLKDHPIDMMISVESLLDVMIKRKL